jgi:hypothetical protein
VNRAPASGVPIVTIGEGISAELGGGVGERAQEIGLDPGRTDRGGGVIGTDRKGIGHFSR